VQVNSLGLTEQQPENNVYRILIEMLAVTLSKKARARAVQLPAWNEALGLPRPWDQQWSLADAADPGLETDLLEYDDLFDGNPAIERKVEALKDGARAELAQIDAMGGAVNAIEYMKSRLVESNADRIAASSRARPCGRRQPLHGGRGKPLTAGDDAIMVGRPEAEADQIARLTSLARGPRRGAVQAALADLRAAARDGRQHHAAVDRRAKAGATTGEWGDVMRSPSSASTARPPASPQPVEPDRGAGRDPRRRRRGVARLGERLKLPHRQARPRRAFERRRTDRRPRPRLRHGDQL
jgi:ethylmalonyl-CoA mutase